MLTPGLDNYGYDGWINGLGDKKEWKGMDK